jgi:PAS domain S-box-containing protein
VNVREDPIDYAALYEHAPVGYLLLEPDSRIRHINATGASMLGWPADWLIGKPLSRWVTGEERNALAVHLRAAAGASGALTQDLRLKQRSGRRSDVRLYTCGRGGSCRTVILDISETMRAERRARAMQDRLAQLTRLGTIGHLTSTLAHELNQPLGTVVLNCDTAVRVLRAQGNSSPDILKSLEQAGEAAAYASEIVRHLRSLIRGDGGERVPTPRRSAAGAR